MAAVSPTTAKVYLCVKATLTVSAAVVNTPVLFNTFFCKQKTEIGKNNETKIFEIDSV